MGAYIQHSTVQESTTQHNIAQHNNRRDTHGPCPTAPMSFAFLTFKAPAWCNWSSL